MRGALVLLTLCACGPNVKGAPRDWVANPAVVEVPVGAAPLWVVSDIHGGFDRLVTLLTAARLIDGARAWSGTNATLLVVGDIIDKGDQSIPCLQLLMALGPQARTAGGDVVVVMGNHEAEFLADPTSNKTAEFIAELRAAGVSPTDVARGDTDAGAWLRALPFVARSGDWLFVHAGNTGGKSWDALAAQLQAAVDRDGYAASELIADHSLLEDRQWWAGTDSAALVDANLIPLGGKHLVFGHDPNAFGRRGRILEQISGRLFQVDVGMSPAVDDSKGALLRIDRSSGKAVAAAFLPDGTNSEVYRE